MSSAAAVRAGATFIEISSDDTAFQAAMKRVHNRMALTARSLREFGTKFTMAGLAMGVPMVMAAKSAATFEDALLELKGAASDVSPDQLAAVREESMRLSRELGIGPEKVAQAFTMLVKAGLSVEDAMAGAAKSAVEFARVSGVEAESAATFMKVAMNVFGVSATQAVDTLSAAADASETDIRHMVEAFGLVGSAGKTFQQSLFGLSQGFAALARYGIQGEEAGTGIKVLLARLVAPSKESEKALGMLGLTVADFRDEAGGLLPISQIVEIISKKLGGMGKEARGVILSQKALMDVFGDRGIKVISAFADMGIEGFNAIADAMESNRPVSEKFAIEMSGISGSFERLSSAVQLLAIGFMANLAPAFKVFSDIAIVVLDHLRWMFENVPFLAPMLATFAAAILALGSAMLATSGVMTAINWAIQFQVVWGARLAAVWGYVTAAIWKAVAAYQALSVAEKRTVVGLVASIVAMTAAFALASWLNQPEAAPDSGKPADAKAVRDAFRDPLGNAGGAPQAQRKRGEGAGMWSGEAAARMGFGPTLSAAEATADNTARTADAVEQIAENTMPSVGGLQSTMATASPASSGGTAARSNAELVSVAERTAIACENSRVLLQRLLDKGGTGAHFA